jgi:hypothetical protein
MEVSGYIYDPAALGVGNNPGTHSILGCVGPRASFDGSDEEKISWLCPESSPGPSKPAE